MTAVNTVLRAESAILGWSTKTSGLSRCGRTPNKNILGVPLVDLDVERFLPMKSDKASGMTSTTVNLTMGD